MLNNYAIKLVKDLKPGEIIIMDNMIVKFNEYRQCRGMGSFDFGEYGYMNYTTYVNRTLLEMGRKKENFNVQTYCNFPVVVVLNIDDYKGTFT